MHVLITKLPMQQSMQLQPGLAQALTKALFPPPHTILANNIHEADEHAPESFMMPRCMLSVTSRFCCTLLSPIHTQQPSV